MEGAAGCRTRGYFRVKRGWGDIPLWWLEPWIIFDRDVSTLGDSRIMEDGQENAAEAKI